MKTYIKTGIVVAAVLGTTGLVFSLARNSHKTTQDLGREAPAPVAGDDLNGSRLTRLPNGIAIDVNASILPAILTADGVSLRPVWTNAVCTQDGVVVGETRFHSLVPSDSTSPIDISVIGVDVTPGPSDPANLRNYRVVLGLRSGTTWGTAIDFDGDLELEVAEGPR
jgi:hypothetical protein